MTQNNTAFRLAPSRFFSDSKIYTLTFDLPGEKVNKFNESVMAEMEKLLPELYEKGKKGEIAALMIVSPKPGIFIAGADIKMIQKTKTADEAALLAQKGQDMLLQWENLPFPTIVAINGAALGGGCEFSLACTSIIMSSDSKAKIGLPEVMLGVIPGMGGCIRLPRKVGLANALDMILASKQLNGERAFKMGLADAYFPKENFEYSAALWVKNNIKSLQKRDRLGKEPKKGGMGGMMGGFLESPFGKSIVFNKAKQGVMKQTKGHYPAPLEALAVIQETFAGIGAPFKGDDARWRFKREAQGFGKMAATPVSKSLIRLFFLTEDVKKASGVKNPESVKTADLVNVGVLGAGVMGGGIAQLAADKAYLVQMKDVQLAGLETGIRSANNIFKKKLKQRRITPREHLQKLSHITPALSYVGFRSNEVVIEAVVENMDIKKKVFAELETHISDDCVVASNTSSLSITEMQKAFRKPERFVGMHFFNPVEKMPLIEVIRGEKSSDVAVKTIFELSKNLGKYPIVVKDAPGFLVNRLLCPYLNEATYLLADGAPIDEIDKNLLKFGMPMGPIELIDEVGVDVGEKVLKILYQAFGDRMMPSPLNHLVVETGRLGKKTKKGFYLYEGEKNTKVFDPEIYNIVKIKPKPGSIKAETMIERCVYPMINEAARCLEDGIVETPDAVDLGMIMGTGFPPFRGGLLRFADSVGLDKIVEALRKLEKEVSPHRYQPSEALLRRAKNEKTFYV